VEIQKVWNFQPHHYQLSLHQFHLSDESAVDTVSPKRVTILALYVNFKRFAPFNLAGIQENNETRVSDVIFTMVNNSERCVFGSVEILSLFILLEGDEGDPLSPQEGGSPRGTSPWPLFSISPVFKENFSSTSRGPSHFYECLNRSGGKRLPQLEKVSEQFFNDF